MKTCKTCNIEKTIGCFEANRGVCKPCRQSSRTQAAKNAKVDPASIPKPAFCDQCGKSNKEVEFKFRTDLIKGGWRTQCNTCYNSKGYCEKSRTKRREEDEEGYLKRNAETHMDWVRRNPEKVRIQQLKTASDNLRKIKTIRTSAQARNIVFSIVDMDEMAAKLSKPCYYCEFTPKENDILNGLDRVDSSLGYTDYNTVPCCATCNAMKGQQSMDMFITNVRRIVNYQKIEYCEAFDRIRLAPFSGRTDLRNAPKKDKTDFLTRDDKLRLWSQPCYLCGRAPAFGIDRVDASGDYTIANSKPCCTNCNYMKKDISLKDFQKHLGYIMYHSDHWTIRDITDEHSIALSGDAREPLGVMDNGEIVLIFPSITRTITMFNLSTQSLPNAIKTGSICRNHRWIPASNRMYNTQNINADKVYEILSSLEPRK